MKPFAFCYGDEIIPFRVTRGDGYSNRVQIKVHPDCTVEVKAPAHATTEAILSAVKKRARWVHTQRQYFASQSEGIMPRQYISGETHYYLGKQHILKVMLIQDGKMPQVKLFRGKLEVFVPHHSVPTVRALLNQWYKTRAKEILKKRLVLMLEKTQWVATPPSWRILAMKTQWGSCSPKGRLTLNPALVKAPVECIDYVILHELCHVAEHNHSKRFYQLMRQVIPQWEKVKQRLDSMAGVLL